MSLESIMKKSLPERSKPKEVKFIDTGFPPLNKILSGRYDGGMPVGRVIEMYGPESSGKTAIATQLMIGAQKAGGVAVFMDHEQSFHIGLAKNLGLDVDDPSFAHVEQETYEASVTQALKVVQEVREGKVIKEDAPIVIVFDSLAAMVPEEKLNKNADELNMRDNMALARVASATMPALAVAARKYDAMFLFLNQMRDNPGIIYGDKKTTPGGNAIKYYASVRIELSRKTNKESDGEITGQLIKCYTKKNKVYRPFETTFWYFGFNKDGTGYFDVTASLVEHLLTIGKLEQSGPRIDWKGKKIFKKQFVEQLEKDGLDELMSMLDD